MDDSAAQSMPRIVPHYGAACCNTNIWAVSWLPPALHCACECNQRTIQCLGLPTIAIEHFCFFAPFFSVLSFANLYSYQRAPVHRSWWGASSRLFILFFSIEHRFCFVLILPSYLADTFHLVVCIIIMITIMLLSSRNSSNQRSLDTDAMYFNRLVWYGSMANTLKNVNFQWPM